MQESILSLNTNMKNIMLEQAEENSKQIEEIANKLSSYGDLDSEGISALDGTDIEEITKILDEIEVIAHDKEIDFDSAKHILDDEKMNKATPLFSGNKTTCVDFNNSTIEERGAKLIIHNDSVFPMNILAIAPHISTSGNGL